MNTSVQTYHTLQQKLGFTNNLPYTQDWSAAADFLGLISNYCLSKKPRTILECSSGLSTIILARCCEINQYGNVISLENGADYSADTRQNISQYALNNYATIVDTPLVKQKIHDNDYLWYDTDISALTEIDLLVIDGPNGYIQKNSRYPALPVLRPVFAKQCTVFLDDAARTDEQAIIAQWRQQYQPSSYEYVDTERGCAILTFTT